MRLLDDAVRKSSRTGLTLGLAVLLASCGRGGAEPLDLANASDAAFEVAASGPQADYPQVLGEPFTVDGQLFTPEDVLSYDSVGYAAIDNAAGPGITVAHKTLPMPSYVEVTALDTGATILARVTERGPMTAARLVALSPDAAAQLGAGEGAAVRVRRVNPPEHERAELRAGKSVPARLEVPQSLLAVLKQNLPATGSASLRSAAAESTAADTTLAAAPPAQPLPALAQVPVEASRPAAPLVATNGPQQAGATDASLARSFDRVMGQRPAGKRSYPLPPLPGASAGAPGAAPVSVTAAPSQPRAVVVAANAAPPTDYSLPGRVTQAAPQQARTVERAPATVVRQISASGNFVVQAAAFSERGNADRAANKLDGFVKKAGRFYRVRTGPYATRGQAEAALAKVRAAGYSDARVFTAG